MSYIESRVIRVVMSLTELTCSRTWFYPLDVQQMVIAFVIILSIVSFGNMPSGTLLLRCGFRGGWARFAFERTPSLSVDPQTRLTILILCILFW